MTGASSVLRLESFFRQKISLSYLILSYLPKFMALTKKNEVMQSRILLVFAVIMMSCNFLFAKEITYVEVTSSDTIYRMSKNYNVIRSADNMGYLQMHAIVDTTGGMTWKTRLIRTNTQGAVIWQYDYCFRGVADTSTCPFAISPNLSGTGYVIAGIWSRTFSLDHSGKVHPFYMEIDDLGQVVQAKRLMISSDTCFAPLKIKPSYPDQTYVVAGVSSDTLSNIKCSYRAGRVCKLSSSLLELPGALEIKSTYASSPVIAFNGYLFDALNNVEVVKDGSDYYYIVSGAVTDDLARKDTLLPIFGQYGRSAPFIAKLDTNLNILWHRADIDGGDWDHGVTTDVVYDSTRYSLYVLSMQPDHFIWHKNLEVREIDFTNGITLQSIKTRSNGIPLGDFRSITIREYYLFNAYIDQGELLLCGYSTLHDASTGGTPPFNDKLDPFVLRLDKSDLTVLNTAWVNWQETFGTLSLSVMQGYLGYRYPDSKGDFTALRSAIGNTVDTFSSSPVIYFPEMSVFAPDSISGEIPPVTPLLQVICGAENYQDLLDATWKHPALYNLLDLENCSVDSSSCNPDFEPGFIARSIDDSYLNYSDFIDSSLTVDSFQLILDSCFETSSSLFRAKKQNGIAIDHTSFSKSSLKGILENTMKLQAIEILQIQDISGKLIDLKTSYLSEGLYVIQLKQTSSLATFEDLIVLKVLVF